MRIIKFTSVTSTQDIAKSYIPQGEELVIWAKEQKKGRGRFEREWYSPEGGLYFSILLFPKPEEIFTIHLRLFLSAVKGIEKVAKIPCLFKWPNDLIYQGKKLGGILLEREGEVVIAGCGINVNNETFPSEIKDAVSLKLIRERETPLEELLKEIIFLYENAPPFPQILSEIRKRNLLKGKYIHLRAFSRLWEGRALDIDEEGKLILSLPEGGILTLISGEVEKVYES
ncbi:MAG: biotin--[acetyl-CoA-carboxylase] ligase [candidate division WOR-3 bacterium]